MTLCEKSFSGFVVVPMLFVLGTDLFMVEVDNGWNVEGPNVQNACDGDEAMFWGRLLLGGGEVDICCCLFEFRYKLFSFSSVVWFENDKLDGFIAVDWV